MDEFIARIEATLTGNARPGQAITPADVEAVKFKVTRHAGCEERTMALQVERLLTAAGIRFVGDLSQAERAP